MNTGTDKAKVTSSYANMETPSPAELLRLAEKGSERQILTEQLVLNISGSVHRPNMHAIPGYRGPRFRC